MIGHHDECIEFHVRQMSRHVKQGQPVRMWDPVFRDIFAHYDEITLKGTFHFSPQDVKKAYLLLKGGKISVKKLISGSFPLKDIQQAFAKLAKGEGIKYALIP